jgi:hypothetical protein
VHQLPVDVVDERLDRGSDGLEAGGAGKVLLHPVRDADADSDDAEEDDDEERDADLTETLPAAHVVSSWCE